MVYTAFLPLYILTISATIGATTILLFMCTGKKIYQKKRAPKGKRKKPLIESKQTMNTAKSAASNKNINVKDPPIIADKNIQMLVECEERTDMIIEEARYRRTEKMKEAPEQADAELAIIRKQLKDNYLKRVRDVKEEHLEHAKNVQEKGKKELQKLAKVVATNKASVLHMLMQQVIEIQPMMHPNQMDLRKRRKMESSKSEQTQSSSSYSYLEPRVRRKDRHHHHHHYHY